MGLMMAILALIGYDTWRAMILLQPSNPTPRQLIYP